ncbi:unnamed protein product [Schistosoma rodhaini]|uniref:Uncharacterized protein n=1 Tax=Schistosoma rodhaini TaxID=6188 RepID=A0AA85GAB4_9TREM|nr:unnamed protein product [Schistosoma rodhaini]
MDHHSFVIHVVGESLRGTTLDNLDISHSSALLQLITAPHTSTTNPVHCCLYSKDIRVKCSYRFGNIKSNSAKLVTLNSRRLLSHRISEISNNRC